MRYLFTFLVGVFALLSAFAQQDYLPEQATDNYQEYRQNFEEWIQGNQSAKGYKWFNRWLNFTETRTGAYGKTVSNTDYLRAAASVAYKKGSNYGSRASDSTWIPEGPDTLTGAYDSFSSHGVARVNTITFHPTDTNTYWVGVSQGGIWKTTNRGASYFPVNEGLPILRISDIAVDPNHPDTLYASVCDYAYIGVALSTDGRKRNTHYGVGIYKSYDGGLTWSPTGLTYAQQEFDYTLIRRVFVNPDNSQELICAGVEGVLKSLDGGDSWNKIYNGLIWDFEQNPKNAKTLYASSGYLFNLGIGEPKMMVSHDFGSTWKTIGTGQFNSTEQMQRVEITISYADTNYLYAVSCNRARGLYGVYVSTDAGTTWTKTIDEASGPNILEWSGGSGSGGQGTYDLTIYTDRKDKNKVFVGGVNLWGSADGGVSWNICSYWLRYYGFTPHADQHYLTFNPLDEKYYLCNDGGIKRTDTIMIGSWSDTRTVPNYEFPTKWEDVSSGMQITSLYRVGLSDSLPGYIISGAQDNGTFYRDSSGKWMNISGGDGMDAVIHRTDPQQGVSSSQYGRFYRFFSGGASVFNLNVFNGGNGGWTTPIEQSPVDAGNYYIGLEDIVLVSGQGGSQTLGNLPSNGNDPISAFAVSGKFPSYLMAAKRPYFANNTNTKLYYTINSGENWVDITEGLPDSLYCTAVAIDDRNPGLLWATFGGFVANQKVYKSIDGGQNWINVSMNLPNIPINTIVQDVQSRDNGIYIGCDVGVYYTNDSTNEWKLYMNSFPNVIVSDLEVHPKERRLYASTFGRGIWSVGAIDTVHQFPKDEKPITGFSKAFDESSYNLYPNPNSGSFMVEIESKNNLDVKLSIVDIMGKRVHREQYAVQKGNSIVKIDADLPSGVYFLRVDNGPNAAKVQRFLITD